MLEKLKYLNDKKILSIYKQLNHFRNKNDIDQLVSLYKICKRDEMVYKLITNYNLLCYRNKNEQIKLINCYIIINEKIKNMLDDIDVTTVESCDFCINKIINEVYNIITNADILEERRTDDIIDLLDAYLNANKLEVNDNDEVNVVNNFSYNMIMNNNILFNFTNDEQIKFITKYSNSLSVDLFSKIPEILESEVIFKERSFCEIEKLLDKYEEIKDQNIFNIIIHPLMLENRTNKQQLELINLYQELNGSEFVRLFTDIDILERREHFEQLELIHYFISNPRNDVYELIISEGLLKTRKHKEQITLIDKYLELEPFEEIFNMLLDEELCRLIPYQFQLNLINNYIAHNAKIAELENMKKLLKMSQDQLKDKNAKIKILELEITKCKK